ncbi:hypothetical protein NEIMUCOT_04881 [Neisseria mucosa ATCC 25996]|uniref:Uncharacterized protein n=1 Tax=Neisseria mucosa (strain ATCC 25996 / DSM 4631 / NCTC 10774 / M26) TaxID=546266 RepID=D2ZW87_NEIM2|nr:hypothetical protein NEIMUCOT_04881 [Neisseria mucosa ATCC 25996]
MDGNGVHDAAFFADNGISDDLNYYLVKIIAKLSVETHLNDFRHAF